MPKLMAFAAATLLATGAAQAQDRELCADRPGLGTPPCTVEAGRVVGEVGLADWTRQTEGSVRTDTLIAGDSLLRFGMADAIEMQVGWTAFGRTVERDFASGSVSRSSGVGDVFVAVRANLWHPDGSGASFAVMPYATLPAGGAAIGAGDWSAGVLLPMSFDLGGVSLALTPQIEAAVDEDRRGRHALYGSVFGLGLELSDALSVSTEVALHRDEDPSGDTTEALAGLSLAWKRDADTQLDAGVNLGLNRDSPDVEFYAGIVRRF